MGHIASALANAGLGSGIQSGVAAYLQQKQLDHQNALAKIKQQAEMDRADTGQAIQLAGLGYRPVTAEEQGTLSSPPPPHMTMLDPASRAGLSQSGIATDNHDGSLTVPDGRPTNVSTFGGHQYAFDPSRMIDLKGGIAEAQYAPKASALHTIQQLKGDQRIDQIDLQGRNQANTANIRGGYQVQTTGMNNAQSDKNNVRTTGTSRDNNIRTTTTSAANNANTVSGAAQRQAAKGASGGGAGAMADVRLQVAGEQIQQADGRMYKFEDGVLNNTGSLNPAGVKLARQAIAGSTTAETLLNSTYPALASYLRDAKQIATAERLISPRGGSNAMTQAEAMLAAAGASASKEQIDAARQYRKTLSHALAGHKQGGAPPPTAQSTEQQQHYDAAAAVLKQQGIDPASKLGPRP